MRRIGKGIGVAEEDEGGANEKGRGDHGHPPYVGTTGAVVGERRCLFGSVGEDLVIHCCFHLVVGVVVLLFGN